jgi:thiol-disulfide isomerase/thioredoxin
MNNKTILFISIIILFVLFLVYLYVKPNYYNSQDNFQNTPDNTNTIMNSEDPDTLYLFYTSWCGASKAFLPEWDKIARLKDIKMVAVDCDKDENQCSANNITGYPTIMLKKSGVSQMLRYVDRGPRTAENVIAFIQSNK